MQRKASWLIPTQAEWKAMLWGGLYALAGCLLLGIFVLSFLSIRHVPSGDYKPWTDPLLLLCCFAFTLGGMLSGLFIYRSLRRKARQRALTSADGWRAGEAVGACFGVTLAVLYIIAPFGSFPTRWRIADALTRLRGWQIREYLHVLLVVVILILVTVAVGMVLGKLLYACGIGADAESEAGVNDRRAERPASGSGCAWLLVLALFTMYFYGDISRAVSKIPLLQPVFMRTGDFGIVSQEPCGPPCFQGITPGVTTINDSYLKLLKAGARCQMSKSAAEAGVPIHNAGVSCYTDSVVISIASRIDQGRQTTGDAQVLVDSIMLKPPVKVSVGQLLARYGDPDGLREHTYQDSSGVQSSMSFYYDKLQTYIEFPVQKAAAFTVAPETMIERVSYQTAANYQKTMGQRQDTQPWKGYGLYSLGTAFLSAPPPAMTPSDFGIISQEPCGPPCFQGIRPGVTTLEDASQILFQLGPSCAVSGGPSEGGTRLNCQGADAHIEIVANGQDGAKLLVESISLLDLPVKVTVGEFVTQYGPPDELIPLEPGSGGADPALLLAYDRLRTVVIVFTPLERAYRIAPETKIAFVNYMIPGRYEKTLSWQVSMGIPCRPWAGYGIYPPAVVLPATLMPLQPSYCRGLR